MKHPKLNIPAYAMTEKEEGLAYLSESIEDIQRLSDKVFSALDKDNSGVLSVEKLKDGFKSVLGEDMRDDVIDGIIKELAGSEGKLTKKELGNWWRWTGGGTTGDLLLNLQRLVSKIARSEGVLE